MCFQSSFRHEKEVKKSGLLVRSPLSFFACILSCIINTALINKITMFYKSDTAKAQNVSEIRYIEEGEGDGRARLF